MRCNRSDACRWCSTWAIFLFCCHWTECYCRAPNINKWWLGSAICASVWRGSRRRIRLDSPQAASSTFLCFQGNPISAFCSHARLRHQIALCPRDTFSLIEVSSRRASQYPLHRIYLDVICSFHWFPRSRCRALRRGLLFSELAFWCSKTTIKQC